VIIKPSLALEGHPLAARNASIRRRDLCLTMLALQAALQRGGACGPAAAHRACIGALQRFYAAAAGDELVRGGYLLRCAHGQRFCSQSRALYAVCRTWL
jgi:hypothetical protein